MSMIVSRGRPISAARLIPRRASRRLPRSERATFPGEEPVLADHYAWCRPEFGHGQDETAAAFALLGPAHDRDRMGRGPEKLFDSWALGPTGVLDRLPRRNFLDRLIGGFHCRRDGLRQRCT